jgi:hypothetical protein
MRRSIATLVVATLGVFSAAPAAPAAPTQVNVRIEGRSRTLFEGPVSTDVHRVRAASDSRWRRCNGIDVNDPWNLTPAVVPTSAAADAMRILGESFDALWYNQYEDYFLKRWGPDEQDAAANEYWGVLVNSVFTSVGGCQYQLDGGDEVLWVYDAFAGRTRLGLYPAGYAGGATPLTATAEPGQPFEVEVDGRSAANEGVPPASPQRGGSPFAGAEVAPVESGEKGFERVETESPETVLTGPDGKASITFADPGWHRIKATVADSQGEETVVRSNRLDVCVPQPPASGCGALPPEDQARTPPPPLAGEGEGEEGEGPGKELPPSDGGAGTPGVQARSATNPPPATAKAVQLRAPRLDSSRIARGLVTVSWRVLDAGVGIRGWSISSKTIGRKGAGWVSRVSGSTHTAATIHLPPGAGYRLQLTVTDVLGRRSKAAIGRVQVPR